MRRDAKRAENPYTPFQKDVALTLFLLGDWSTGAAVDFLQQSNPDDVELWRQVETWAAEAPLDTLVAMREQAWAPRPNVYKVAHTYYVKWRLARAVEGLNDQGVAPPTASCM